MEDKYCCSCCT